MAQSARVIIGLQCEICKEINYTKTKNPKNTKAAIKLKKFCSRCKKHTMHKEVKIK
ncbi:50S ribosomal protein L33 [Candidatus Dojkabacteria bacterium]|nr:50S ribosomal protein L33 [Candidatus Dojkabacteria bacterium]